MFMAKDQLGETVPLPVIFVVDDEVMLLELAEIILTPEGFVVRTFRDPEQAVAEYAAAKPPPCIVITDYAMNGMNGLDVIRECRRLNPQQRIIMVSGTVDEGIYANVDMKPDCFLSKPYNAEQLVATVRALINF